MKKHDVRIVLRLPATDRQKAEQLVKEGKFKSLSQVIRTALKQFLETA
jgi:Arc/MetJ-type ribon-helix-helix transcriptional regulator